MNGAALVPLYCIVISSIVAPFLANWLQNRREAKKGAVATAAKLSSDTLEAWSQIAQGLREELATAKQEFRAEIANLRNEVASERAQRETLLRENGDLRSAVARLEGVQKERDRWFEFAESLREENKTLRARLEARATVPPIEAAHG